MNVLYRPQRGGLDEAMADLKVFSSVEEMIDFLVETHGGAFCKSDIYISYYGYDERIDWMTYIVRVGRYRSYDYMKKYGCPQAIGYCTFVDSYKHNKEFKDADQAYKIRELYQSFHEKMMEYINEEFEKIRKQLEAEG